MHTFSPIRVLVIMVYFLACTACGQPSGQAAQNNGDSNQGSAATDINFIGGGTQAPDIQQEEQPYRSPNIDSLPPTELNFFSTIDQAVRIAGNDNRYRICVFFYNNECDECTTIEQVVFLDPEVIRISKYWLFVKVDASQNRDLTNYYIQGAEPPAFVFLDRTGNEYRKYFGTVSTEEFLTMLNNWR
jgi:thioredoxin-related protein